MPLRNFQVPAKNGLIKRSESHRATADMSEPGTGKTWIAAFFAAELLASGRIKGVCVICPPNVKLEWKACLKVNHVPTLFIESYERLSQGKSIWFTSAAKSQDGVSRWNLDGEILLIFDEAHKASGKESLMSKLLIAARNGFSRGLRVHVMSGTLGPTPLHFYALGYLFGFHKLTDWKKFLKTHHCFESEEFGWRYNYESDGMTQLNAALQPFAVRLVKSEIPDFPKKQFQTLLLPDIDGQIETVIADTLAGCTYKGEIPTTNEIYGAATKVRTAVEFAKVPQVVLTATEKLYDGYSVVVFFNFDCSINYFGDMLRELDIPFSEIRGGQTEIVREENRMKFQRNEVPVILVNMQAGGTGCNLQDEHGGHPRLSLLFPGVRVIDIVQAMDRIHRATSLTPATVVMVLVDVGPEKKLWSKLRKKVDAIDQLNDKDLSDTYDTYITSELAASAESRRELSLGGDFKLPFEI